MNYGEFLRNARKAAGLSQEKLADLVTSHGHSITGANITMIERGYDKTKSGEPTRPRKDFVIVSAKVLGIDVNTALMTADYAPIADSLPKQPHTVGEIVRDLQESGVVDQIHFNEADLADLPPDELALVRTLIQTVIELSVRRARKEGLDK